MKNEKEQIVLTGDRPTGRLHLGHYVGSILNRLKLQESGSPFFYMIADVQALTDNADNPEKVRENVLEVALDNLACGMDPEKTTMFVQSQVPEIAELTVFFLNLVTVNRLFQNPTVKSEAEQKFYKEVQNFEDKSFSKEEAPIPAGFLMYPVSQASDILTFKSNTIPVGVDQLPMIEQANEIAEKFNRFYGEVFPHIEAVVSETSRLVGIDGDAKMSKSLGNCIYLSDTKEEIEKKVMAMYTDPNHLKVEDPGQVEGNVVFTYLDIFDQNKEEVAELKSQYQNGGLGDVVIKKRLIDVLDNMLAPIRARREELSKNPEAIYKILSDGTLRAREVAKQTMSEVRAKMGINYF